MNLQVILGFFSLRKCTYNNNKKSDKVATQLKDFWASIGFDWFNFIRNGFDLGLAEV